MKKYMLLLFLGRYSCQLNIRNWLMILTFAQAKILNILLR